MIALKMPPSRPRRRPHELSFSADERPPLLTAVTLGFQHAVITLGLMVGLSVWGNRRLKLLALLIGVIGGVAAALVMGELKGGDILLAAPPISVPALVKPVLDVPFSILLGLAFIAILTQIDTV